MSEIRKYDRGTSLTIDYPWSVYRGGRVLCSDGKVRALKRIALTADTYFSVPAAVTVNGKTVSGYVTIDSVYSVSAERYNDQRVALFVAVIYGKNHALLPDGRYQDN
jgi:hypothetical protein